MLRESLLARTLVELADTLVDDFDVVDLLTLLADRCVETLDVAAAGILLASPDGRLRVLASTSDAMRVLELLEVQAEEGPCLDCFHTGRPVPREDLAGAGARWPRFVPEALEAGFHSVQALPLRLRNTVIGALNLFHTEATEAERADVEVAQAFADIATIAILQHRAAREAQVVNDQLNRALNSRIVIEQAKGVLAEREGLDVQQAFERLRRHARNHNLRLADLANDVITGAVSTATLDASPLGKQR
jgi:GAF domain-containing protein